MLHFSERSYPSDLRLGAILAGGRSRRFGSPKSLAALGGASLVERVAEAVRGAGAHAVAITAPELPDLDHILPCRADLAPGRGPLGGIHTALTWGRELGLTGTLCVACDTPFVPAGLLRIIAEMGEATRGVAVVPESHGPRGVEPLCAWYPTDAIREIEERLAADQLSMSALVAALPVSRVPLAMVREFGEPGTIFLNVNTPADRERAAAIHSSGEQVDGAR